MLRHSVRILAVSCGLLLTVGGAAAADTYAAGSAPAAGPPAVNTPAPAKVAGGPGIVDPGFAATVQGYPDPGFTATVQGYPDRGFAVQLPAPR
jgi:hypothetical protein